MTSVCCLFVRGEYPYTPEYVWRLFRGVGRWLAGQAWRFVVLTDQPKAEDFHNYDVVEVRRLPGFAFWTKLELFNPARQWRGRVVYFDLDTLIVGCPSPIINAPADFAITADPERRTVPKVRDAHGRRIVRRFNSSVMAWDGGTHTELYTDWTPAVAERLSGDQDWIAERLPEAHAMPRSWFPRLSESVGDERLNIGPEAKVVLCKVPKNHIAADQWPWFADLWRAA